MDLMGLLFSVNMLMKPIKIAILDTGYAKSQVFNKCPGEKDYSESGIYDTNGHGTNITGIISSRLSGYNYCILPIKVFYGDLGGQDAIIAGIKYAISQNVDIINLSGGGAGASEEEKSAVEDALNKNIKLVFAAGNDGHNLDSSCNYFPACYNSHIEVVGSIDKNNNLSDFSNFGSVVKYWQHGRNVTGGGITLSGTSQAAALQSAIEAKRIILNNHR